MLLYYILILLTALAFVVTLKTPAKNGHRQLHSLDINATTALCGLLALGIVLSHLHIFCYKSQGIEITKGFVSLAQTGVFFFISGYGLTYAYNHRRCYLKGFLTHRISKILMPMVIATLTYVLCFNFIFPQYTYTLSDALDGDTPLPFSWYCYDIILYYSVFYITLRICPNIKCAIISLFALTILMYVIYGRILHWGIWYYRSNIGLNVGMLVCHYEKSLKYICTRFTIPCICIIPLILACVYSGGHFGIEMEAAAIGYSLIILILMYTLGIVDSPILQWLGKHSYEIYLMQGFAIFTYPLWPFHHPLGEAIYMVIAIMAIFLLATGLKFVTSKINP